MEADGARWSERSRKSLTYEAHLRGEMGKLLKRSEGLDADISELVEAKALALTTTRHGSPVGEGRLRELLPAIESKTRLLAAYKEEIAVIEEQLENFLAGERQEAPERRAQQEAIAQLAQEIITKDSRIERAIAELRQLLEERRELSAAIRESCARLGFAEDGDWRRLEDILESLPQSVLPESRLWASRFLGKAEGSTPFFVVSERFEVAETLAHSGVYTFGEAVHLAESEAQELLSAEPPSIMISEHFQAIQAEARETGVTPGIVLLIRKRDRGAARSARVPSVVHE